MADGAVYNPHTDIIVIAAVPLLQGRAQGTYFTFSYDAPDFYTATAGVEGGGFYRKHDNRAATMTVVVMPNSVDNDVLQNLLTAQEASPVGIRYPIMVQQGLSIYTGFGLVAGPPPLEFSDSPITRTWKIISTRMLGQLAGQPAAPIG